MIMTMMAFMSCHVTLSEILPWNFDNTQHICDQMRSILAFLSFPKAFYRHSFSFHYSPLHVKHITLPHVPIIEWKMSVLTVMVGWRETNLVDL